MRKGSAEPTLLQEPPPRGTTEQHQPALPFGEARSWCCFCGSRIRRFRWRFFLEAAVDAIASTQIVRAAKLMVARITSQLLLVSGTAERSPSLSVSCAGWRFDHHGSRVCRKLAQVFAPKSLVPIVRPADHLIRSLRRIVGSASAAAAKLRADRAGRKWSGRPLASLASQP